MISKLPWRLDNACRGTVFSADNKLVAVNSQFLCQEDVEFVIEVTDAMAKLDRAWGALIRIVAELDKAEGKFPWWPTDPIHASAILNEEAGELTQACLNFTYAEGEMESAVLEAAQVGAMAIRFLMGVGGYTKSRGEQQCGMGCTG